jgi:hypothetical protein
MLDIIQYDKIEMKKILESASFAPMDAHQSLVHTLDMMDFMNALKRRVDAVEDSIEWIVLELETQGNNFDNIENLLD